MDYQALAESCFSFNKNLNRIHMSMDGTSFALKGDCMMHARTQTDASIKVFERQGPNIVEVTALSTAETVESNTPPNYQKDFKERTKESQTGTGTADLAGQQHALAELTLLVQNAATVDEVNTLIVGQTDTTLLAAAHARTLFLEA